MKWVKRSGVERRASVWRAEGSGGRAEGSGGERSGAEGRGVERRGAEGSGGRAEGSGAGERRGADKDLP